MASCSSASARSNATHYHTRQLVVERQQSAEPPALSGRCEDLSPCWKAPRRPRVRRSCQRQSSSRACWCNVGAAHTSRPFASERFSPRAPAPVAPPLPAQHAIRRDRSDESALAPRRSKLPPTPRPRRKAGGSESRRQADKRSARARTHASIRSRSRRTAADSGSGKTGRASIGDEATGWGSGMEATAAACSIIVVGVATSPSRQSSPRASSYRGTEILFPSRSMTSISRSESSPPHLKTTVCRRLVVVADLEAGR